LNSLPRRTAAAAVSEGGSGGPLRAGSATPEVGRVALCGRTGPDATERLTCDVVTRGEPRCLGNNGPERTP